MGFVIENTDMELIKLNDSLRSKLKEKGQPSVITFITQEHFSEIFSSNADPDFKNCDITDVYWTEVFLKNTTIMR